MVLAVLAALVGLCLYVATSSDTDFGDIATGVTNVFRRGNGYPISTSNGSVISLDAVGKNVALLNDTNLLCYSGNGVEQRSILHGYYNPVLKTSANRMLLYDQGGSGLQVHTVNKELFSTVYENDIVTAQINDRGTVAVVTTSSRSAARGQVYNSDFATIYEWYNESLVTALALSQKDNLMAVGTVDTVEGALTSYVSLYRFSSDQVVAKITMEEQIILSMAYRGNDNVLYVITDKSVYTISSQGLVINRYNYGGEKLWAFGNDSEDYLVLALGDYTEQRKLTIYRLDQSLLPQNGTVSIREHMIGFVCHGKELYILTDNTLYKYGEDMTLLAVYDVPDARAVQIVGSDIFYASGGKIDKASEKE